MVWREGRDVTELGCEMLHPTVNNGEGKEDPERVLVKGADHLSWGSGMSQLSCFSLFL